MYVHTSQAEGGKAMTYLRSIDLYFLTVLDRG
jgi:hypothetical protein